MQTLGDIKALLASHGLSPKHRLGQNFLHDPRKMDKILAAADIHGGDVVLEVGPGTGVLSECVLDAGARLVCIEIDRDLEPILTERLGHRATVIFEDILSDKHTINPRAIESIQALQSRAAGENFRGRGFKVVANLPYQIASPLIANLALDHPGMSRAVVMVQREVGDRLAAQPGGKTYGPLGIVVQAVCEVAAVATLPPGCFWPAPKIDSVVLRIDRRATPLTDDPHGLSRFVHRLFNQRRKQVGTILGRATPLPNGIDPRKRPEQLTLEQLIKLARLPLDGPVIRS